MTFLDLNLNHLNPQDLSDLSQTPGGFLHGAALYFFSDEDKENLALTIQGGQGGDSTIAFCMVKESQELLEVLWPMIEAQMPDEVEVEGRKVKIIWHLCADLAV